MKTFIIVYAILMALSGFYMMAYCLVSFRSHFVLAFRFFPPVRLYEEIIVFLRNKFPEHPMKNAYTLSIFLPYLAVRFALFGAFMIFLIFFVILYPFFFILYLIRLYLKKKFFRNKKNQK